VNLKWREDEQEIGRETGVKFEEGVRKTVEWYLGNKGWLEKKDTDE